MDDAAQPVTLPQLRSVHARQMQERPGTPLGYKARPLRAWEYRFIEWEAVQPRWSATRRKAVVLEMFKHFMAEDKDVWKEAAGRSDDDFRKQIRLLRLSVGYKTYRKMLDDSILSAARYRLENSALKYVNAHEQGLALAIEARDHSAIPRYTESMIDRIWPKREEQRPVQVVNVILTEKQQIADVDYIDVTAERVD